MFGILKKIFEKAPPENEKLPYYDIVCPYCFAKFHHEDVVFRATHHRDDDEAYALQEDEKLNIYRGKFDLAPIDELEAVIDLSSIPEENKIYSGRVIVGLSDKYSEVTKNRLCPECHNDLPITAGKYPSNIISIVGATAVGKSVYITSLIHILQHVTANNFDAACIPLDNGISRRFRQEYEAPLFENNHLLQATAITKRQEPLIFQFVFKDENRSPLTLVFFDVAGDGMTSKEYIKKQAGHIKNSAGILFLVDPMQIRTIREKLLHQLGDNPGDITNTADEPREIVLALYDEFIAHQENSKTDIPTAIVLTKSDLLNALKSDDGEYIRTNSNVFNNVVHREFLNLDEFENINGEMKRFLSKVDIPFVNAIDVYFRETSYFAVSALGSNPIEQQVSGIISPIRVDEPFIWLLYKLGVIEGRHE
ncbi:TRAFAC clade GTPase domain-containing protein [Neobacillus vireti]|uniref:TRAFAC clade GTPase domain-containing protein n=1 Tax=Neobacillus vireti TaxID=220686 RepID=UPI002FFF1941